MPHPVLRISYDGDIDFLWALVPGEVVDEHQEDETEALAGNAWWYRRGAGGPLIGFGVADAFAWDVAAEPDAAPIWDAPRFAVPTLGLRAASVGEVVLAAQQTLDGTTPDLLYFDAAVEARDGDEGLEESEALWRDCLACGDMRAHYGLGYTLVDRGRPREAFGHLAAYTEICPRNPWAWLWRARAAEAMGEHAEAAASHRRARACQAEGGYGRLTSADD